MPDAIESFDVARSSKDAGGRVTQQYDADFWHKRAEEARAIAELMSLSVAKREMEFIAAAYDRLGDRAERTAGRKGSRDRS